MYSLRGRHPKGRNRGKTSMQSAGGSWYLLPPVLIFTFLPPFLWPAMQATLHNVIVATEYVRGCL